MIGAGGTIGTWGVLLAKHYGAEVTAVDRTDKLSMLLDIGADHVIDYTREDFSDNGVKYDVVLDLVYKSSFSKCLRSTAINGYYLMGNTGPWRMLKSVWVDMFSSKKVKFALASETITDFNHLASLIQTGKIKPVIDRAYPLVQTVDAHSYVEQGIKKGSVLIQVS